MNKIFLLVVLCALPCVCFAQIHGGARSTSDSVAMSRDLNAVTVYGKSSRRQDLMRSTQSIVSVDRSFIDGNLGGSLMQSLERIPGVKAMSIGTGESKPVIRGLGFNRMAVTDNNIKHEGQQWGEDHGLEISQWDVDRINILKGPSALVCGSDAIGGVVSIVSNDIPTRKCEGSGRMMYQSNNDCVGVAARIGGIADNGFYYRISLSGSSFADYHVPTDSIQYYSYYINLKNRRLRNTAGYNADCSLLTGYRANRWGTSIKVSELNGKSGFFANAHGLEVRLSEIDYDCSARDIDLPFHTVNHLKILSHSYAKMSAWNMSLDLSYQDNIRKEMSEPVSHGYMPKPESTLERSFHKGTSTVLLTAKKLVAGVHSVRIGANAEYQHNTKDGWGFIIPDFSNATAGLYLHDRWHVREGLVLDAGMRYDATHTIIDNYTDWYLTEGEYKTRANGCDLTFGSFTWSLGVNYDAGAWVLKANAGKGFRTPIPKELGCNGVNYHIFRYERGNSELNPEESYQLDIGATFLKKRFSMQIEPYVNYFDNYIYLNPTSEYDEGLQVYNYAESKVFRCGGELLITYDWLPWLSEEFAGEYLFARQLTGEKKGYTLPFSQPWQVMSTFRVKKKGWETSLVGTYTGCQKQIVPPEKTTDGHFVVDASVARSFEYLNHRRLMLSIQIQNMFNCKYYDHTSYYRLIGVPEPGINFTIVASYSF